MFLFHLGSYISTNILTDGFSIYTQDRHLPKPLRKLKLKNAIFALQRHPRGCAPAISLQTLCLRLVGF